MKTGAGIKGAQFDFHLRAPLMFSLLFMTAAKYSLDDSTQQMKSHSQAQKWYQLHAGTCDVIIPYFVHFKETVPIWF